MENEVEAAVKTIACSFVEWAEKNRFVKYWGSDGPNAGKWYMQYTKPDRRYLTTPELYDLFLEESP